MYWFPGFAISHAVTAVRVDTHSKRALKRARQEFEAGSDESFFHHLNVARYSLVIEFSVDDAHALGLCTQFGLDGRAARERIEAARREVLCEKEPAGHVAPPHETAK